MLELSTDEYALIMQPLIQAANYFKSNSELGKQIAEATAILKKSAKGVPLGGSASTNLSKEQKIKDLFHTFGLSDRIGGQYQVSS